MATKFRAHITPAMIRRAYEVVENGGDAVGNCPLVQFFRVRFPDASYIGAGRSSVQVAFLNKPTRTFEASNPKRCEDFTWDFDWYRVKGRKGRIEKVKPTSITFVEQDEQ